MIQFSIANALTAIVALVATAPLPVHAASSEFGLYAYGQGIGGFPVFSVDYLAYVGLVDSAENATSVAGQNVYFTLSDGSLTAFPNSTVNDTSHSLPSDGAAFFVPTTAGAQLGYSNGTSSGITSGFLMYGNVLMIRIDGAYVSTFSLVPTSTTGVWTLNWNATSDTSAIPVTLKNVPPSIQPPRPSGAPRQTSTQ